MTQTPQTIGPGMRVKFHFAITLEDGTVAESTFEDEPVDIVIGAGDLHQGLERLLYGLKASESRTFQISPVEGFGVRDPEAIHTMHRREFPADLKLEPGVIIEFNTPAGDEVPGMIRGLSGDEVEVDFNHPLAGHEITFRVEILALSD